MANFTNSIQQEVFNSNIYKVIGDFSFKPNGEKTIKNFTLNSHSIVLLENPKIKMKKKILLGGTLALSIASPVAVILVWNENRKKSVDHQENIKSVREAIVDSITKRGFVANITSPIKAISSENAVNLSEQEIKTFIGQGLDALPIKEGMKIKYYSENEVKDNEVGTVKIIITSGDYKSAPIDIKVEVGLVIVDSLQKAQNYLAFDSNAKTLTVSKDVAEINFELSKVPGFKEAEKIIFISPQHITKIGTSAFSEFKSLTTIDLKSLLNLQFIGGRAFQNTTIKDLDLGNLKNLVNISYEAFEGNLISKLNISRLSNLKEIGSAAFDDAKLEELDLSSLKNLEKIGRRAFNSSPLISKNNGVNTSGLTFGNLSKLKEIGVSAFANAEITELDLSGLTALETIDSWSFDNAKLTKLDLSKNVNLIKIGNDDFEDSPIIHLNMTGLTKIKEIGDEAFFSYKRNNNNKIIKMDVEVWYKLIKSVNSFGPDRRTIVFGPGNSDLDVDWSHEN